MKAAKFKRRSDIRLILLLLFLFSCLSYVFSKLIVIQVVEATNLSKRAMSQRLKTIEVPFTRGLILDRQAEELAVSLDVEAVFATPYLIKNPEKAAFGLAPILEIEEKEVYEKLTKKTGFVYLARKVDKEKTEKIKDLKIEGIGFIKDSKRCYPFKELGAQVIGFVGIDNKGLNALEYYYNDVLSGEKGVLISEMDPWGRSIPEGDYQYDKEIDGNSIITTLDKDIQYKAEIELKKCVEEYSAKGGTVIVIDPEDASIYAMANYPTFDLNAFEETPKEDWRNRAVCDLYEPGSTMKAIIATMAIEEKIYSPDSVLHVPSSLKIGTAIIGEAHHRPEGDYTLSEIITKSYNVGAVLIGMKLGKERIYNYLKEFGFGEKTGIDFPGEAAGYLLHPDKWSKTTIANIPFGQGISVTPLQMIRALSVIANGGFLVEPHFVDRIIGNDAETINTKNNLESKKIISSQTSEQVRNMLEKAVRDGTGKGARIEGYKVAGKTGTAQKAKTGKPGYEEGKYIASFMGFVPVNEPKLAIIVIIDEPQGAYYGGVVAAPVFKEVAEFSLRHLKIPPEKEEEIED